MSKFTYASWAFGLLLLAGCATPNPEKPAKSATRVRMETTAGTMVLQLSDKTPQHRDNFIGLVEEGAYDSVLFHRVIDNYVIQAGDPNSKNAPVGESLGHGDRDYRVPAEFDTALFHRRGALGAARNGNPERASSAMQFYIVQRGPQTDSLIDRSEERINKWLSENRTINAPQHAALKKAVVEAQEVEDWTSYAVLYDSLVELAASDAADRYIVPPHHRATYREIGGAPHLDQNYTIFGEVISGMEVVDRIAAQPVDERDRPITDIRILRMEVVSRHKNESP